MNVIPLPVRTGRPVTSPSQATDRRHMLACLRAALVTEVAAAFSVPVDTLTTSRRGSPAIARARQCAMYLAHTAFGLSHRAVGLMFGRDRTTVAHACRRIEDWRDNSSADAVLLTLEESCRAVAGERA